MDAKSKANFINAVAAGEAVICPKCGTSNEPNTNFCISCGTKVTKPEPEKAPAFQKADEPAVVKKAVKYTEPSSVFAQGLPEWSIEPPQVMVRRR